MNRKEVMQTLTILKAAYPSSFKDMTKLDGDALVNLWARQFAEEDPVAVMAAVENLISTRSVGYSPTIGEIKEQLHSLRTVNGLTDAEAWCMVEKACRRGLYNAREEFEKLPSDVQAAVGGPEQLKAWAAMDAETVNSVVASNFRKTFRAVQIREKEKALMPPEVKAFVAGIAENMKIGGNERKALEEKKQPAVLPASFQPMAFSQNHEAKQDPKPIQQRSEYTPMQEDAWIKKRDEFLRMMSGSKGGQK